MMPEREWIGKTEAFLRKRFDESAYLASHPEAKAYRLEHTFRVANIARQIAVREGLDETGAVIAGLLHDIAYCEEFGEDGWQEHGRRSARIARPFLTELGMAAERVNDICFAIAIHVDDRADFPGERTAFAETVGDADNIDRFDAYRIHESLSRDGFLEMTFGEKREYTAKRLERLRELTVFPMGTATAAALWKERLSFYIEFYEKLAEQLRCSTGVGG